METAMKRFRPRFTQRATVSASVSETERATPPQRRGNDPPNADETRTEIRDQKQIRRRLLELSPRA